MNQSVKTLMRSRYILPAAAVTALSVIALTGTLAITPAAAATEGATLSPQQITKQLLAKGYSKVIRMEMEDGLYEVKVKTADGKRQKLNVDPKTGKVLGEHKDGIFSN